MAGFKVEIRLTDATSTPHGAALRDAVLPFASLSREASSYPRAVDAFVKGLGASAYPLHEAPPTSILPLSPRPRLGVWGAVQSFLSEMKWQVRRRFMEENLAGFPFLLMIFFPDLRYSSEVARLDEQLQEYDAAAAKKERKQEISPGEMKLLADKDLQALARRRDLILPDYGNALAEVRQHPLLHMRDRVRGIFAQHRRADFAEVWRHLAESEGLSPDAYGYLLLKDAPESAFEAWRERRYPGGETTQEKLSAAKAAMLWLNEYPVPAGAAYCKRYLYHPDPALRMASARALVALREPSVSESAPMLLQMARNSRNPMELRLAAVEVLESLGRGESIRALAGELFEAFKGRVVSGEKGLPLLEAMRAALRSAHVLQKLGVSVDGSGLFRAFAVLQTSDPEWSNSPLLREAVQFLEASFLLGNLPASAPDRKLGAKVDPRQEDPDWVASLQAVPYEQIAKIIQEEGLRDSFLNLTQEYKLLSPDFDWANFKPDSGGTFFSVALQISQVTLALKAESRISKEGKQAMMRAVPAEAVKILADAAATCHHTPITGLILLNHYGNPHALPFLLGLDIRPLLLEAKRHGREAKMIILMLASLGHREAARSPYGKPKKVDFN